MDALLEILCYYLKIDGKFVQKFYGFVYLTVPKMSSNENTQQPVKSTSAANEVAGVSGTNGKPKSSKKKSAAKSGGVGTEASVNSAQAGVSDANGKTESSPAAVAGGGVETKEPVNSAQAGVSDANGKTESFPDPADVKAIRRARRAALLAAASSPDTANATSPPPATANATADAVAGGDSATSPPPATAAPADAAASASVAGGGASATTAAKAYSKIHAKCGNVKGVQPCAVPQPAIANFKAVVSAETPDDPALSDFVKTAKQELARLEAEKTAEEILSKKENEKREKAEQDANYKKLLEEHNKDHRKTLIKLQEVSSKLKNKPFTEEDMTQWRSLATNPKAAESGKISAQSILAAHATLLIEIESLKKKLAELNANKPLSPEQQASREQAAKEAQQNAAVKVTEQETEARKDAFNEKFDNFMASSRGSPAYLFQKAVKAAMSPQGASVVKLCFKGFDPAILTCISAKSGEAFVPLFRIDTGTISLVPNWKGLFQKYNASKASKDGESLSEEDYYNRCVMIAVFNFWKHAKTILTRKNMSRSESLTMLHLLSNASNISDEYEFKKRQEFVSQQREQYRVQKAKEKQEAEAVASTKSKPYGSSNSFSVLAESSCDNQVLRPSAGGAAAVVSAADVVSAAVDPGAVDPADGGAAPVEEGFGDRIDPQTGLKIRGSRRHGPVPQSDRPKKGVITSPTNEQKMLLFALLAQIGKSFGGLSTTPESFNNDSAAWGGNRSQIIEVLRYLGVNTTKQEAVFQFFWDNKFMKKEKTQIRSSNGKDKTVHLILDKDQNVVQKTSAASATGGAAAVDA